MLLFIFCSITFKYRRKIDLLLLFSILIGFLLSSAFTISKFRPITFYILIPFVVLACSRAFSFLVKSIKPLLLEIYWKEEIKFKIKISLVYLLLLTCMIDLFLLFQEIQGIVISDENFYLFCTKELADEIKTFNRTIVLFKIHSDFPIEHFLEYRCYETGYPPLNLIKAPVELEKNALVIFFDTSPNEFTIDKSKILQTFKHSNYTLSFLKTIKCDEPNGFSAVYTIYLLNSLG